jgi:hypothetical protein
VDNHNDVAQQPEIALPASPSNAHLSDFQVLPGGGFLLLIEGYGLREMDATGNVVWEYLDPGATHDADRLANGNTLYVRGWAPKGEVMVREVDPTGATVFEWTGMDAYGGDPRFPDFPDEGWAHLNAVTRLDSGITVLCARNWNALVAVSPGGERVFEYTFDSPADTLYADTSGAVEGDRPHAAEWLSENRVLLGLRNPHRVVEVQLADNSVVWSWRGTSVKGIKDADRLPDGHTLVSARDSLVELDAVGNVVWGRYAPPEDTGAMDTGAPGMVPHQFGSVVRLDSTGAVIDVD